MMNLLRLEYSEAGIFGELTDTDESFILQTLEHSYPVTQDSISTSTAYLPKVPVGQYTCVRGLHRLSSLIPFETFEVMGVPNHTGILFHPGNTEGDSSGCVLLGTVRTGNTILQSRDAFNLFMEALLGIQSFELVIN